MKSFDSDKGKISSANLMGPLPRPNPVPITPRLMRSVPANISSVIGNFDEMESA